MPASIGIPENQVWGIDQLSERPQFVRRTSPVYPTRAQLRGLEGKVELQIVFNKEGRVEELEILSSDHGGIFDRSALAAVKSWQIKPMTRDGKPVSVRFTQTVDFYLKAGR